MRSRSTLEWSGLTLGALTHGVWLGLLAAAFTSVGWPLLAGCAAAILLAAAAVTRWTLADARRLRAGRLRLAAVVLVAVAALFAAGRGWEREFVVWQIAGDALFTAFAALLGVWVGRKDDGPEEAFGRSARAFGAVCAILVAARLSDTPLEGQMAAVAAVLVFGGLHVAAARYRALTDVVSADDRLPFWPWLLAVAAAIAAVLVVSGLAASLLDAAAVRSVAGGVLTLAGYAGTVIGYAGGGVLRAIDWLASLVHLDLSLPRPRPPVTVVRPLPTATGEAASEGSRLISIVVLVAAAAMAVAAAVAVVVFALRRLQRRERPKEAVAEEREVVRSVRSATAGNLGDLRRRLRTLIRGRRAHTPAELVRLRYEQLERRLTRAGSPRAPWTTVREYLSSCAGTGQPDLAAELAGVYELARYSDRAVDGAQARRFEELARSFPALELSPD